MAEEPDFYQSGANSISPKTVISISLSSFYYVAAGLCSLGWLVIRLWVSGLEDELRARHTAQIAEESARVQDIAALNSRITKLEHEHVEFKSIHGNYDRGFDAAWKKFDRLEDDRWNTRNGKR